MREKERLTLYLVSLTKLLALVTSLVRAILLGLLRWSQTLAHSLQTRLNAIISTIVIISLQVHSEPE